METNRDNRGSRGHVVRGINHDYHGSRLPRFFFLLIRLYQLCLSPLLGTRCRFEPSCSHYAQDAMLQHGVAKGGLLTLRRLLRCHPFGKSGYDPVPPL